MKNTSLIPLIFLPFRDEINILTFMYLSKLYTLHCVLGQIFYALEEGELISRILTIGHINILSMFCTLRICIRGTTDPIGERWGVHIYVPLHHC